MSLSVAERVAVELGRAILDEALVGVGEPPAALNSAVREIEPVGGLLPVFRLEKPGRMPITVQLGLDMEVAIGPFSEFLVHQVVDSRSALVRSDLEKVLRAETHLRRSRLSPSSTLQLYLDGAPLWGRATYLRGRPGGTHEPTPGRYRPFAVKP